MTFAGLGLPPPLLLALDALAYRTPTAVQAEAIPAILAGRDLRAAAATGTGKTASFALPLLQLAASAGQPVASNCVRALVVVPSRELAEQVHASLRAYGQHLTLRSCAVYGGVSINPQMMKMRKGMDVVVATPGRLLDLHRQNAIQFKQLQTLVLDEADRMLDFGFAGELQALFTLLPRRRQTLLFSATFSDAVRELAAGLLDDPLLIEASAPNRPAEGVRQRVVPVDKKRKTELFLHLLASRRWGQVLAFVRTRKGVDELVATLQQAGISADSIHGDKPQPARLRALERFKAQEVRILVATDVAARGLDIDALPVVVNVDLPIVAEDYIHRIGRTGRNGASGDAYSLVCADEVGLLAAIETLIGQLFERVEEAGFTPQHRVPETNALGQLVKKPKKPKKPKLKTPSPDLPAAPPAGPARREAAARRPGRRAPPRKPGAR